MTQELFAVTVEMTDDFAIETGIKSVTLHVPATHLRHVTDRVAEFAFGDSLPSSLKVVTDNVVAVRMVS